MTPFTYHRPLDLSDAVAMLGEPDRQARVIAGGQSLLLWMKDRSARPDRLISIASLPGLKGLAQAEDGGLRIGAATTYATLAEAPLPGWQREIASVAGNLADRSVRSLGTIGGALCDGNPRYDMPTLVMAMDATMTVSSSGGERLIAARDFFAATGGTTLAPADLLVSIAAPARERFDRLCFEKFRHRMFEAAVVTICCAAKFDVNGAIAELRIAAGALGKAPRLATKTAADLAGVEPGRVDVGRVSRDAADELMPAEDRDTRQKSYQAELVVSLTSRALTRAFAAGGR